MRSKVSKVQVYAAIIGILLLVLFRDLVTITYYKHIGIALAYLAVVFALPPIIRNREDSEKIFIPLKDQFDKWSRNRESVLNVTRRTSNILAYVLISSGIVIACIHLMLYYDLLRTGEIRDFLDGLPIIALVWKPSALAYIFFVFLFLYGKLRQITWARNRLRIIDAVIGELRTEGFPFLRNGAIEKESLYRLIERILKSCIDCTSFGGMKNLWSLGGAGPKLAAVYLPDGKFFRIWHLEGEDKRIYMNVARENSPVMLKEKEWDKEVEKYCMLPKRKRKMQSQVLSKKRNSFISDIGMIYQYKKSEISTDLEKCKAHDNSYLKYLVDGNKITHKFRSMLCLPLFDQWDGAIGVLAVYGCGSWTEFDTTDLRHVKILRNIIGILLNYGLDNGLYNERPFSSPVEEKP